MGSLHFFQMMQPELSNQSRDDSIARQNLWNNGCIAMVMHAANISIEHVIQTENFKKSHNRWHRQNLNAQQQNN